AAHLYFCGLSRAGVQSAVLCTGPLVAPIPRGTVSDAAAALVAWRMAAFLAAHWLPLALPGLWPPGHLACWLGTAVGGLRPKPDSHAHGGISGAVAPATRPGSGLIALADSRSAGHQSLAWRPGPQANHLDPVRRKTCAGGSGAARYSPGHQMAGLLRHAHPGTAARSERGTLG